MKITLNRLLGLLFIMMALMTACDDDDGGTPLLIDFSVIQDDWSTQTWETDPSGNVGLLSISFNETTATGEIIGVSLNEWGFTCDEVTLRNIVPGDATSFNAEGLIRFTDGSSEWVPATIALVSPNEISITFDCGTCSNEVLTLTRLAGTVTASVIIDDNIDEALTLTKINCNLDAVDYLVTDFIDVNDVLTIEPGVIIAFEANAGLNINRFSDGVIIADGTASDPITFTGATQTKGYWRGVRVETNDVRNLMDYVIIEYAGSDEIADDINGGVNAALALDWEPSDLNSSLSLTNSIIRENDGYGLVVEKQCILRAFSTNTFQDNTDAAVLMEAPNVGELDNVSNYSGGNGYEGVEIAGTSGNNLMTEDATWPGLKDGAAYYVSEDIDVRATLTIMPGATLEFEANTTMLFKQDFSGPEDGILIAKGTSTDPITFSGFTKTPGYWGGIVIESNSILNEIDHCVIEFGGSDVIADEPANITLNKNGAFAAPDLIVTNSTIRNSAGCGIVVDSFGGNLTESGNTFSSNAGGNICN